MMFEPEKVERVNVDDVHGEYVSYGGDYVRASDYDQLLALYRELQSQNQEDFHPNHRGLARMVAGTYVMKP